MAAAKAKDKVEKELWLGFARDALSRYTAPDRKIDSDGLVDDMVEVATKYADSMLDELDKRYGGGGRKLVRRKRPEEDEDEDEDDEDDEDDEEEDEDDEEEDGE